MDINPSLIHIGYLLSISLFIIGIKRLSKVKTARSANALAALAMLIAIVCQLVELGKIDYTLIIAGMLAGTVIGAFLARTVEMTAMPQLVGVFNGFGGAASAVVALSLFAAGDKEGSLSTMVVQGVSGFDTALTMVFSIVIGTVTFSGSLLAYFKLSSVFGRWFGKPIMLPLRHIINICLAVAVIWFGYLLLSINGNPDGLLNAVIGITVVSLALGVLVVAPIGGADMPVVISLLNSYSGLAAAATGFVLQAPVLIVSGALVGASGLILTNIMCRGMNRSLLNVMIGGFGAVDSKGAGGSSEYENVKSADAEEAALDFDSAQSVIVVPGYGLAVAQAQNAIADFANVLKQRGCRVRYAIHPVAGRMPGHMNVLLAEGNVPYDQLFEMDEINEDFRDTDIALVVGANDVVNPVAKEDSTSPLYGMPILDVENARQVFVIKRSLSPGFAGVKNELFERENCRMVYGDAKKVIESLTNELNEL